MALTIGGPMSQNIPQMDPGLQRPRSGLARGVQITELSDGCMNPEPIVMQESDLLMEQYLSPTKLQLLSGCEDLESVETLELKVDTRETTLNNFGTLLPRLRVLKLSGSIIPIIRDLGSWLRQLEVLWMSSCGLKELDGISSMLRLRELYLAYNQITDISPLTMLEDLTILDLEGNKVADADQIQYLTMCPKLLHLTMEGNPVCLAPNPQASQTTYNYRQTVKRILVGLLTLDDRSITEDDASSSHNVFDADWAYLEELQQDAVLQETAEQEGEAVSVAGRPTTAALRPATSYKPGSALRPSSGFRPGSGSRRPSSMSGGRASTAWTEGPATRPASSDAAEGSESISNLTCGNVICGNPSMALRARRRTGSSQDETSSQQSSETSLPSAKPEAPSPMAAEKSVEGTGEEGAGEEGAARGSSPFALGPVEEKDLTALMQELRSWKMEHEQRMERIRQSKAPQVLTIEHHQPGDDTTDPAVSGASDSEDADADSAMDRYLSQVARDLRSMDSNPSGADSWRAGATPDSDDAGTSASQIEKELLAAKFPSDEEEGSEGVSALSVNKRRKWRRVKDDEKASPGAGQWRMRSYEKSLGQDDRLLQEYRRLRERPRRAESGGETEGSPREQQPLRELRLPQARVRPPSPLRMRPPSTQASPFPTSSADMRHLLGADTSARERTKKVRIGPTGLPASTQAQQRDVLKPALGALLPSPRPPSSSPSPASSLQHRIRQTMPEVLPLPSRPPPFTKS